MEGSSRVSIHARMNITVKKVLLKWATEGVIKSLNLHEETNMNKKIMKFLIG